MCVVWKRGLCGVSQIKLSHPCYHDSVTASRQLWSHHECSALPLSGCFSHSHFSLCEQWPALRPAPGARLNLSQRHTQSHAGGGGVWKTVSRACLKCPKAARDKGELAEGIIWATAAGRCVDSLWTGTRQMNKDTLSAFQMAFWDGRPTGQSTGIKVTFSNPHI